jgi:hypothetical protein
VLALSVCLSCVCLSVSVCLSISRALSVSLCVCLACFHTTTFLTITMHDLHHLILSSQISSMHGLHPSPPPSRRSPPYTHVSPISSSTSPPHISPCTAYIHRPLKDALHTPTSLPFPTPLLLPPQSLSLSLSLTVTYLQHAGLIPLALALARTPPIHRRRVVTRARP